MNALKTYGLPFVITVVAVIVALAVHQKYVAKHLA